MIQIEPPSSPAVADEVAALTRSGLTRFVKRAQSAVGLAGSVEVLLSSDAVIKRLNREFRGKNKATDVLSFPADPIPGLPTAMQTAGDLAVSLDTASRQAAEHGHGLEEELRILLLHGLLHLSGMDHEMDAGEMAAREAELRLKLKLSAGLIARTLDAPATTKTKAGKTVAKPAKKAVGKTASAAKPKAAAAKRTPAKKPASSKRSPAGVR